MSFFTLAFKNTLRYKVRNLLTIAGIAASISVLFSIVSFNRGFEKSLNKELEKTGVHFMIVPSGCPHEVASLVLHGAVSPQLLDLSIMEKIKDNKNILFATPILVAQLLRQGKNRMDLVYGLDMSHIDKLKPSWNLQGSIANNDNEIIVGHDVAKHDDVKIGDVFVYSPANKFLKVSAIIDKTGTQDDAFIYLPISVLQDLIGKHDRASAIGVRVKDITIVGEVVNELSKSLPGIQIVTMSQVTNTISTLANSAKILTLSLAMIAILISSISVMNSILMAVFERTQEIGMMRAIGASRADIFKIIISETIILTAIGGTIGVALANMASTIIEKFVRKFVPYVPGGKMIIFDPYLALLCVILSVLLGIAAGAYPAWGASKISPMEAIRQ